MFLGNSIAKSGIVSSMRWWGFACEMTDALNGAIGMMTEVELVKM